MVSAASALTCRHRSYGAPMRRRCPPSKRRASPSQPATVPGSRLRSARSRRANLETTSVRCGDRGGSRAFCSSCGRRRVCATRSSCAKSSDRPAVCRRSRPAAVAAVCDTPSAASRRRFRKRPPGQRRLQIAAPCRSYSDRMRIHVSARRPLRDPSPRSGARLRPPAKSAPGFADGTSSESLSHRICVPPSAASGMRRSKARRDRPHRCFPARAK